MNQREIKFRAWDKKGKEMFALNSSDFRIQFGGNGFAIFVFDEQPTVEDGVTVFRQRWEHLDCELMQFTGLKDKNGKDIYEGDIIRILYSDWASKNEDDPRTLEQYLIDKSTTGYVSWDEHGTGWVMRVKSKYSVNDDGTVMSSIIHGAHGFSEVIGTIHQNPELS